MAVEVKLIRTLRGWDFADDEGREASKAYKIGQTVKAILAATREVNPFRRYWFGMIQLVLDNSEIFGSKEEAEDSIKLSVGHVTQAQEYRNGQWSITRTPKTVAGKALNEAEWIDLNRRTEKLICEVLCVSEEQLFEAMTDWIAPGFRRDPAPSSPVQGRKVSADV